MGAYGVVASARMQPVQMGRSITAGTAISSEVCATSASSPLCCDWDCHPHRRTHFWLLYIYSTCPG